MSGAVVCTVSTSVPLTSILFVHMCVCHGRLAVVRIGCNKLSL